MVDSQDANGTVTSTSYSEPLGRLTQLTAAANQPIHAQTNIAYKDVAHTITTTRDQKSFGDSTIRSALTYDGLGRTVSTYQYEDGGEYVTTSKVSFDGLGRVQSQANPFRSGDAQVATAIFYDGLNRPTTVVETDGAVNSISYAGNATIATDPSGKSRTSVTDGLGRLSQVIEDPFGARYTTNYTYSALDDLTLISQGTVVRNFSYDSLKRLVTATNPEAGPITYSYDLNGNVIQRIDNRGIKTTFSYDALNRLIQKRYSDGTPTVSYGYDGTASAFSVGRLTSTSSSISSSLILAYDALGRVIRSMQSTGKQNYSFSYTYNLAGSQATETYPTGRTVTFNRDTADRVSAVFNSSTTGLPAYATNVQYAPQGSMQSLQLGNGLYQQTAFNVRLQPTAISLGTQSNPLSILRLLYTYSDRGANNGNVGIQTIQIPGLSASPVQTYSYDALNRLTQAVESVATSISWSQSYVYDQYGNRAVLAGSYIPVPALTPQSLSNYDIKTNRFSVFVYDGAGNITSDLLRNFGYDAENRQTSILVPEAGITTYSYDGSDYRVQKVEGSSITTYVYDIFGHLSAEYSSQTSVDAGSAFPIADHLGSIRVVTDANGTVKSRHDYLPFGEEIDRSLGARNAGAEYSATDSLSQRFTGRERDAESGLDYFRTRYYSSAQGRFQGPDAIPVSRRPRRSRLGAPPESDLRFPQSLNLYSYAANNPLLYVDENGTYPAIFLKWGDAINTSRLFNWSIQHPWQAGPLVGIGSGALLVGGDVVSGLGTLGRVALGSAGLSQLIQAATTTCKTDCEEEAETIENELPTDKSKLFHIFADKAGHLIDTPGNRQLLIDVANEKENLLGPDKYGNTWYAKLLPDGTQVWVETRGGQIANAGLNLEPRTYNPQTGLSLPAK